MPPSVSGSTNIVPTTSPTVTVDSVRTTNTSNTTTTSFSSGQQIRLKATLTNNVGSAVPVLLSWEAIGPRELLVATETRTIATGTNEITLPDIISVPTNYWQGNYSLRVRATYGGLTSGASSAFSLTGTIPDDYIVLTWNDTVNDLDANFWVPDGAGGWRRIYKSDLGQLGSVPNAALDLNDTNSPGIEVIALTSFQANSVFAVYNADTSKGLGGSLAAVRYYKNGSLAGEWQAPTGSGTWWNVFTIDGSGVASETNTLSSSPPH